MRKINIPKELLIQLYVNEELTTMQIAEELGVNRQTICNKLSEFSIPKKDTRFKKKPKGKKILKRVPKYKDKSDFEKVYKELKSMDLLAEHYNINITTAFNWKRKHGIKAINQFSRKAIEEINKGKPWCNKDTLKEYYSKYSIYDLASMWSCDPTTISKWLKKFNIPRRTPAEQWELRTKFGDRIVTEGVFDLSKYKEKYKTFGNLSKVARKYIIDRVGKCQACGYSEVLDLHHINENHKDNRPENHAILCPNCHAKIHRLGLTVEKLCPNFISWDKIGG